VRTPNPPYAGVFFDVDSTLVRLEGIDWLAAGNVEVVAMTRAAMEGSMAIEEVYARRLEFLRPDARLLAELAGVYCDSMVDGADHLFDALRGAGSDIHLVSAGIEQAILPLAAKLGLAPRAVHAVRLELDAAGQYRDFDRRSLLTRSNGKSIVIRDLRARSHGRAALVGDGMSDAEAREEVDLFIGFGGVAVRPLVRELADVFVESPTLDTLVPYLVGEITTRSES
jgi:phosphoserine phosphatase